MKTDSSPFHFISGSSLKGAFVASLLALAGGSAHATPMLITTDAGYTGPGLDLSAYANGNYNFTFGPIIVDGYTFTAAPGGGGNSGMGSVVGQGDYGLAGNGSFGDPAVYIGVDSGTGYADLWLNGGPVSQLGFFMNYAPGVGDPATIWALDSMFNPIGLGFDLTSLAPISTPGGFNAFEFRGIADDTASIYGLRFGGNYILVTGTRDGSVNVPEITNTALLFGLGLACLGVFGRMPKRRAATAVA